MSVSTTNKALFGGFKLNQIQIKINSILTLNLDWLAQVRFTWASDKFLDKSLKKCQKRVARKIKENYQSQEKFVEKKAREQKKSLYKMNLSTIFYRLNLELRLFLFKLNSF